MEQSCLAVMIDDRLCFNSHVDYACVKVAKANNVVARIMQNNSEQNSSERRLLASFSSSILSPAWITALEAKQN